MSAPLLLEVAPDLVFLFEESPPRLARRIAVFGHYFVGRGLPRTAEPLVVRSAPPPFEGFADEPVVVEGVAVHRRDGALLFEAPGVRAWVESPRAGFELENPTARQLDAFVWTVLPALLFELAQERDWLGFHAAALAADGRGLLLPGASGTGKSTIFRNAHRAGLGVLSDDLVWVRESAAGFHLHAFPRGWPAERLPGEPIPDPTVDDVPLAAVVCPTISGRCANRLHALALPKVLEVLAMQCGFPGLGARAGPCFRRLVRVASSVPAFRLEAGRDGGAVPALLRRLVQKEGSGPRRQMPT